MTRREMLQKVGTMVMGMSVTMAITTPQPKLPEPTPEKLPRWRGFNLLGMFVFGVNWVEGRFDEREFEWIAELGFNFVRLPLDYRFWTDPTDWTKIRDEALKPLDDAVKFGEKWGIHVQLNFHRAPGYCVNPPPEPKSLWTDEEALKVCAQHWAYFAKRYAGIPNKQLSFNLFNEPARLEPSVHRKVVERVVEAIRQHDAQRLIVCDGREWGNAPPTELIGLQVATATRGYRPMQVTHYRASWIRGSDTWAEPTWPLKVGNDVWDKERLRREQIEPWKRLEAQGVGVMVGEFGVYNKTPHKVALAFLGDCLELWKEAGWGWALWNFRGSFGVLDSGRADVTYENWRGHQLDRAMLELLQAY